MPDKSFVTMEQHVCPVCMKTFDTGALLMDLRLREQFDSTTLTDWELCPECQRLHDDGFVALVAVDEAKSKDLTPAGVWRTGELVRIRRSAWNKIFSTEPPEVFGFCPPEVIKLLKEVRK